MSTKNFVSYGDAETIFTKIANAIKGKKDEYETITYAQWLTLSPEQRAAKDYYISDYPASAITAGNVSYDNTESGMAANEAQSAIDELKSGLNGVIKHFVPPSEIVTSSIYGDVSIATGLDLTGKAVFSVDKLAYGGDIYATIVAVYANGVVTLKLRKHSDYSPVAEQQIDISDIMLLIV